MAVENNNEHNDSMNQKPFRTLLIWVIWASTSLIVYLALYSGSNVWDFIAHDPSRVTWIIIAFFLIAVIASFTLTVMLTFEWQRAYATHEIAARDGLAKIECPSLRRSIDRFYRALQTTVDIDGSPDVEALLTLELAGFRRIGHSIDVAGNLMITLGLVGTVMGLTMTLTGLEGSLQALGHDQELLLSGLRHAMSGMGTAFYTTLLGAVLGGILLRVCAHITEQSVEGLYDFVTKTCLVYCSAEYKPSLQRDLRFVNTELSALQGNARHIKEALLSSKDAMEVFYAEVRRFNSRRDENDEESLESAIARHRRYCDVLREEVLLLHAVNTSWWARVKSLIRLR